MSRVTSSPLQIQCLAYMNLENVYPSTIISIQQVQPHQPPDSAPLTQHDLTQLQFPFFQAPRTPNWHSNFKKKFISTTFTPLLRALKHRITPTGLVISGFVSIYVTLPSQPNLPIFVSMLPF